MKLQARPWRTTQDGRVIVKSSDKTWSTEERNGNPLQNSCCKNAVDGMKRQKDMMPEDQPLLRWKVSDMLLGKSGEISPERMKRMGQSRNDAQVLMCLVVKVKSKEQYCKGTWNVRP